MTAWDILELAQHQVIHVEDFTPEEQEEILMLVRLLY